MSKLSELLKALSNRNEDVEWVVSSFEPSALEVRERIDGMWQVFSPLADAEFVTEFAAVPNNRYWEMFLGYHFSKYEDLKVSAPKPGPDLSVKSSRFGTVLIEATSLSPGEAGRAASLPPLDGGEWWQSDKIALRYAQALADKRKKLHAWVEKKTVPRDVPYLIAINAFDLGGRRATHEDALSAVYPFAAGARTYRIGANSEIIDEVLTYTPNIVCGSKVVPRDVFIDGSFSDVSGVLHCASNWMWPYEEMVLKTAIISNPTCLIGLPDGDFGFGTRYDCTIEGSRWKVEEIRCARRV